MESFKSLHKKTIFSTILKSNSDKKNKYEAYYKFGRHANYNEKIDVNGRIKNKLRETKLG